MKNNQSFFVIVLAAVCVTSVASCASKSEESGDATKTGKAGGISTSQPAPAMSPPSAAAAAAAADFERQRNAALSAIRKPKNKINAFA
jgi:hypothetical protein